MRHYVGLVDVLYVPYLFDQMTRLLFFSLLVIVQLLFEAAFISLKKPVDISDGWIMYVRAIQ